jgi:hypothetical protein
MEGKEENISKNNEPDWKLELKVYPKKIYP